MKVKYIAETYRSGRLEDLINSFIKDKKVIDIKYQDTPLGNLQYNNLEGVRSALIMYEEQPTSQCPYCHNYIDSDGYDHKYYFDDIWDSKEIKWVGKELPAILGSPDDYDNIKWEETTGDIILQVNNQVLMWIADGEFRTFMKIKRCPMCGRKFKQMNLLEQYIVPGYIVSVLKGDASPIKGVTCVKYEGKVDCYGNVSEVTKIFTLDDWCKIKKQGYYMA